MNSWTDFLDYINRLAEYTTYIFRGQETEKWDLTPSLFRPYKDLDAEKLSSIREKHFKRFVASTRGRRGLSPPNLNNENLWWALGQHHGLRTPLLDWTESPFVALYFAFKPKNAEEKDFRMVYCLSEYGINKKIEALKKIQKIKEIGHNFETKISSRRDEFVRLASGQATSSKIKPVPPDIVEIVRPLSDENARLVSQRGVFVRVPDRIKLEEWIAEQFKGDDKKHRFIKIRIPNSKRDECLRYLNRMNINHLSLFPDLYGASEFCNTHLEIPKY